MTKILTILLVSFMMLACGGSSSPADTADLATSTPISSNAVAMAVAVSEAGGDAGHMMTVVDVTVTPNVKSSVPLLSDGVLTWKLEEHAAPATNGTGSFVFNGTTALEMNGRVYDLKSSGNLDVQLKDITKTISVDGADHATTINGKLKIVFSGIEMPSDVKESQIYTNITYTITGSDLEVTGAASGTIIDLKAERIMKIIMVDGVAKRVSTCSGTATVKTDEGTATCTYQADCSKCS